MKFLEIDLKIDLGSDLGKSPDNGLAGGIADRPIPGSAADLGGSWRILVKIE